MIKRTLSLAIVLILLASPAGAGGFLEVALGIVYGTSTGIIVGGTALIWAADPDEQYPVYLGFGAGLGFAMGLVYGTVAPPIGQTQELCRSGGPALYWTLGQSYLSVYPQQAVSAFLMNLTNATTQWRANLIEWRF